MRCNYRDFVTDYVIIPAESFCNETMQGKDFVSVSYSIRDLEIGIVLILASAFLFVLLVKVKIERKRVKCVSSEEGEPKC